MRTELRTAAARALAILALAAPAIALGQAPERIDGDQMVLNADRTIARNQHVTGDVLVMGGDLRVEGRIDGDVVVARGDLTLAPTAVVGGDAVVSDGKLVNEGARVAGEVRAVGLGSLPAADRRQGTEFGNQIRFEAGRFTAMSDGIAGIFETLAFGLLIAGVGAAVVFFANDRLARVSDAVRNDAMRAGALGLLGNVLALPAWVLLIAALSVTIIGIPLAVLVVFLYWPALIALAAVGTAVVAHAVGERTAEKQGSTQPYARNAYTYVAMGVAILLLPMMAAQLLQMTGMVGWVGGLLQALSWVLVWGAASLGTGALLLTRGGTRPIWNGAVDDDLFDFDGRETSPA